MASLIRMNAWTPKQWELIMSKLHFHKFLSDFAPGTDAKGATQNKRK